MYVGTELTLTSGITFPDMSGIDVGISVDVSWTRGSGDIYNGTRTTVSPVSGSGSSYTASLSFSPITSSDAGSINATVTVRPSTPSQYIENGTASSTQELVVEGMCHMMC